MADVMADAGFEALCREADYYLVESAKAMRDYEAVDAYDSLFSEAEEVKLTEQANIKATEKSKGLLRKAFDAIIKFLKGLASRIADFFRRLTMSSEERMGLKKLEQIMKENPETRHLKITVKDYRKINAQIDEYMKEVETAMREAKKNEKTPVEKLISKITNFLGSTSKALAVTLTADVAWREAANNVNFARALQTAINAGIVDTEAMRKEMGDRAVDKWEKDIKKYTKVNKLRGLWNKLTLKKYNNLNESIMGTIHHLGQAITGTGIMGKAFNDNENLRTVKTAGIEGAKLGVKTLGVKGTAKAAKSGVSSWLSNRKAKKAVKEGYDDIEDIENFIENFYGEDAELDDGPFATESGGIKDSLARARGEQSNSKESGHAAAVAIAKKKKAEEDIEVSKAKADAAAKKLDISGVTKHTLDQGNHMITAQQAAADAEMQKEMGKMSGDMDKKTTETFVSLHDNRSDKKKALDAKINARAMKEETEVSSWDMGDTEKGW